VACVVERSANNRSPVNLAHLTQAFGTTQGKPQPLFRIGSFSTTTSQHSSRLTFCTVYWMPRAVEPHCDSPRLQRRKAPFATHRRIGSFNGTVSRGTAPFPFPHVKHWPCTERRVSRNTSLDEPSPLSPWCKIQQWPPCLCHNSHLSSLPRSLKANGGHADASAIQRSHEAGSAPHL
jgi:hypothetical protein